MTVVEEAEKTQVACPDGCGTLPPAHDGYLELRTLAGPRRIPITADELEEGWFWMVASIDGRILSEHLIVRQTVVERVLVHDSIAVREAWREHAGKCPNA